MNTTHSDDTLHISGILELTAANCQDVKNLVRSRFEKTLKNLDLDCTRLDFVDSSGLGALISMQKLANERGGKLRLLAPEPPVVQVLELTRLHRVFEITP